MKKIIIILVIALLICGGLWYFDGNNEIENANNEVIENNVAQKNTVNEEADDKYSKLKVDNFFENVIKGKEKIKTASGEYTIVEYLQGNDSFLDDGNDAEYSLTSYANVDFDGDGIDEVVFLLDYKIDGAYAILHYENGEVYGYQYLVYRAIENLKDDGEFIASNGAKDYSYNTFKFDKENIEFVENASIETVEDDRSEYKVDEKIVTEKEFKNYEKKFNDKKDAKFENFEI